MIQLAEGIGPTIPGQGGGLVNASGQLVTIRANDQAFRKLKEVRALSFRLVHSVLCAVNGALPSRVVYRVRGFLLLSYLPIDFLWRFIFCV